MLRSCRQFGIVPGIALALFMLAAQSLVLGHDLDHDAAKAQNQVCTTCVAAGQLGAAAVDQHDDFEIMLFAVPFEPAASAGFISVHAAIIRQRGPPHST